MGQQEAESSRLKQGWCEGQVNGVLRRELGRTNSGEVRTTL